MDTDGRRCAAGRMDAGDRMAVTKEGKRMGQLQRDDRRIARQETIELWGIEGGGARSPRPRQRRALGQGPERRTSGQRPERRTSGQRPERRESGQGPERRTSGQRPERRESGQGSQRRELRPVREEAQARSRRPQRKSGQRRQHRPEEELQFLLPVDYPQAGNPKPVQSIKRRKARRRKIFLSRAVVVLFIVVCLILVYLAAGAAYRYIHRDMIRETTKKDEEVSTLSDKLNGTKIAPPEIMEDFLEVNDYSRPGTKLDEVKSVFVHYTANPKTSAQNNRSYFANLAQTHEREASAHLIIGYEGEIIQCIPFDEQAYAVRTRNGDSISIECCYLAEDGSFTQETYDTLLHTLAWLLEKYDLTTEDILRHYDCGGKKCPLYYVEHEDAWEQLLLDVEAYEASIK